MFFRENTPKSVVGVCTCDDCAAASAHSDALTPVARSSVTRRISVIFLSDGDGEETRVGCTMGREKDMVLAVIRGDEGPVGGHGQREKNRALRHGVCTLFSQKQGGKNVARYSTRNYVLFLSQNVC